jgi:hypothetical protein
MAVRTPLSNRLGITPSEGYSCLSRDRTWEKSFLPMEEGEDKLKFLCGRLDGDLTKGEET